ILREGLRPMGRRYVHLSAEPGRARAVGSRHGPLVLLLVDAAGLTQAGQPFYQAQNGALLTDAVPPAFLRLKEG
ncbi:MAG: RNA 2'-phosphotransferase, partial [Pseudomonadota bacterium]